eukprot:1198840-Pyramimonas_sp.AAC.1
MGHVHHCQGSNPRQVQSSIKKRDRALVVQARFRASPIQWYLPRPLTLRPRHIGRAAWLLGRSRDSRR